MGILRGGVQEEMKLTQTDSLNAKALDVFVMPW
jgi:hypothetical protein